MTGRGDASRPSVLLVTSNGTGMGHLARQSAVARALQDDADVALLSLSSGLPVVAAQGLRSEYLPSYQRPWLPWRAWKRYLADRVEALVDEVGADAVVFDGVAPYSGLLTARHRLPGTAFVWFRRGMWQPGRNTAALRAEPFFDAVLEPGDLADAADHGPTAGRDGVLRVPPVSVLDVVDLLPRDEAAAALGLDPSLRTALLTLGSGASGDVEDAARALRTALVADGWQVATTRAALAADGSAEPGVTELRGVYPLARYLRAFDLAVSAAGYNAVHELVASGVPTLLVPDATTSTDDQVARARELDRVGAAVRAEPGADGALAGLRRLLASLDEVGTAGRALGAELTRGAQAAAAGVLDLLDGWPHNRAQAVDSAYRRLVARETVVDTGNAAIPDALLSKVRTSLGRSPLPPGAQRREVDLVLRPDVDASSVRGLATSGTGLPVCDVTSELDMARLREDRPLEHVLPGASAEYVARRVDIARAAYRTGAVVRGA